MPADLPPPTENSDSSALADQMMANLTAAPEPAAPAAAPATPDPAPAPAAKPAEPPKPAPVAATPTKPAEPVKPTPAAPVKPAAAPAPKVDDIDDPKLTAPDLRRRLKEVTQQLTTTKAEKETSLAQVNARLREFESKKFWTDEDQRRVDELTKGKQDIERQLYSKNYADSPEYKKLYVDKLNNQAAEATNVFTALNVKTSDDTTRPATQADMLRLYNAPPAERRKMAKAMFPEDFQEALDAVAPMIETNRLARVAIEEKRANYEQEQQQQEVTTRTQNQQFETGVRSATEGLAKSKPEIFGVPTDPKEKALYDGSVKFVDELSTRGAQLPPAERAARFALVRSMAISGPILMARLDALAAENAALLAELTPLRRSDPGNLGDNGSGGGAAPADGGMDTNKMAEIFDKA